MKQPTFHQGVTLFLWSGLGYKTAWPPSVMYPTKETADEVASILGLKAFKEENAGGSYATDVTGNLVSVYMLNRDGNPLSGAIAAGPAAKLLWEDQLYGKTSGRQQLERDIKSAAGEI